MFNNKEKNHTLFKTRHLKTNTTIPNRVSLFKSYLSVFNKLVPILSLFSVFFGGMTIFNYLKYIQHTNIFPEIIDTSFFITTAIVFVVFFILLSLGFLIPYFYFLDTSFNKLAINSFLKSYKLTYIPNSFLWLFFYPASIIIIYLIIVFFQSIQNLLYLWLLVYVFLTMVLFYKFCIYFFKKNHKLKKIIKHFKQSSNVLNFLLNHYFLLVIAIIIYSLVSYLYLFSFLPNTVLINLNSTIPIWASIILWLIWLSFNLYINNKAHGKLDLLFNDVFIIVIFAFFYLFVMLSICIPMALYWAKNNSYIILFIIMYIVLTLISAFLITVITNKSINQNNDTDFEKNKYTTLSIALVSTFLCLIIPVFYVDNFSQKILSPISFIETPKQASWYLINEEFLVSNQLQTEDKTNLLKQQFLFPKINCLKNNETCKINLKANQNSHAFFGYMALNMGKNKIFCPQSIVFSTADSKNNTHLGAKCLVLKETDIQAIDPSYIP